MRFDPPCLTAERDDDAPDHPTEREEEEEAGDGQYDGGRERVDQCHHDDGGDHLQTDNDQLDSDLSCEVVGGVDSLGPVPSQGPALQLRHNEVSSEAESHQEQRAGNHPG